MRILNATALTSHGNVAGRQAVVDILEAGLQAANPYHNTRQALHLDSHTLTVGGPDFAPPGDPRRDPETIDLDQVKRIYVLGAGKGIQYMARAIEDVLGERLTGGHVIAKHGDEPLLSRIGVTYGAHPVPDEGCVQGCRRILEIADQLRPDDLVFTVVGNGVSSLLTLPAADVSLEDVRQITFLMQIERGAPTGDLNPVRNHLDQLKGGRLAARIQPARAIHLLGVAALPFEQLMDHNLWLHSLPDCTTFSDAIDKLKKWDAWDAASESVRQHLLRADPAQETIKAESFQRWQWRIFGMMPDHLSMLAMARHRAAGLGFRPYLLSQSLVAEAGQAGLVLADIALQIARTGEPFAPPCALFRGGELLVTVGQETGIGGRNQEFALAAVTRIAGHERIVIGSVDSDGTDGPGGQFFQNGNMPVLAGGLVDGQTAARARAQGWDIHRELGRHNTSPLLWSLDDGIVATPNISINDLTVILVQ